MTTMTNKKTTTENISSAPQDPWEMTCAVLAALWQTEAKAEADYIARCGDINTKRFTNGVGQAGSLLEILSDNRKRLEAEMRRHARSCGLEMPKLER